MDKPAYEVRMSDWRSDVCSSDLLELPAIVGVQRGLERPLHDAVVLPAIGDQVGDGRDLEAVKLRHLHQVGQERHRAVLIHDLADHAGRIEASQRAEVRRVGKEGVSRFESRGWPYLEKTKQ